MRKSTRNKHFRSNKNDQESSKVYKIHQRQAESSKVSWKQLAQTISFKTKLNNPLPAPSLPSFQLVMGKKDWFPHRNSASSSISSPTIHSSLFFSSRIKGHLLEAPPTSWTWLHNCLQPPHPLCLPGLPPQSSHNYDSKGSEGWISGCLPPKGRLQEPTHDGRGLAHPCSSGPQL